jgi:hypothetical protein
MLRTASIAVGAQAPLVQLIFVVAAVEIVTSASAAARLFAINIPTAVAKRKDIRIRLHQAAIECTLVLAQSSICFDQPPLL